MTPEQKIREQRLIEATQKNYIGLNTGKIGCILKFLGQPIMSHSSSMYDETLFESPYDAQDDEEMPVFSEDESTSNIGYVFDGLSRGMHLEIKYLNGNLSVYYKGFLVYLENSGELECFFPQPEWEEKLEDLYKIATKMQRKLRQEAKIENQKIKEATKKKWLIEIWKKWGI